MQKHEPDQSYTEDRTLSAGVAFRRPAPERRHVGLHPDLVDEHRPARVDPTSMAPPPLATAFHVRTFALIGNQRLFLENEPAAAQKTSDSIVPHLAPALRQHLLQHGRRVPYPIQQPTPARLQNRAAIPAHLRRPHRAGPRHAQSPLHKARQRNSKPLRSPATTLSGLHRGNNTFAKIIRVRSRHPYRPPSPVWILNHSQPSQRNPNPIHSKTEPASYHWPMGLTPLWISIWCRFRFTFIEGWRF